MWCKWCYCIFHNTAKHIKMRLKPKMRENWIFWSNPGILAGSKTTPATNTNKRNSVILRIQFLAPKLFMGRTRTSSSPGFYEYRIPLDLKKRYRRTSRPLQLRPVEALWFQTKTSCFHPKKRPKVNVSSNNVGNFEENNSNDRGKNTSVIECVFLFLVFNDKLWNQMKSLIT